MKALIRSSAAVSAFIFALSSSGVLIAQAATTGTTTTPTPMTSTATSDLTAGPLTLTAVPSFDFGTATLTGTTGDKVPGSSVTGALKVTNPGQIGGWQVTVAGTPFTDTSGTALTGTILSLDGLATNPITADDSTNTSTLPTFVTPETISTSATVVESAAPSTSTSHIGIGSYTTSYDAAASSLAVPSSTVAGTYTSTLTWTMSNAPA
ncbi:WxL domain-containing protein [Companilactobacillus mishanensis]|uniref:WxL domain-containing protein n=1 Tax=Companilactobacillus mishanensis TaxID=2486008 RepID=UPI000F7B29B3|nr:WxL domain-containing protein [Companilactobacillus mishanensis]